MKFTIDSKDFAQLLKRVVSVAKTAQNMPALACVYLHLEGGVLRATCTDLEVTLCAEAGVGAHDTGRALVDARRLHAVARSLPAGDVLVSVSDEQHMTLRSGQAEVVLHGIDFGALPKTPSDTGATYTAIDAAALRFLLERTAFSMADDASRPNLCGVYLEAEDDTLRAVSTDGHRLSQAQVTMAGGAALGGGILVPRRGVQEALALLREVGEVVEVALLDNMLVLRAEGLTLYARLVDANFPNYRQVMPKSHRQRAQVSRTELQAALRRMGLLASGRTHGVRLEFAEGTMVLSSDNPDLGRAREQLCITGFEGTPLNIAFNSRYVSDLLGVLDTELVEVQLSEPLAPGLWRAVGQDDARFVVMPMKI